MTLNAPAVGTAAQRTVTLASGNTRGHRSRERGCRGGGNYGDVYRDISRRPCDSQSGDYGHPEWIDHRILTVNPVLVAGVTLNPTSVVGGGDEFDGDSDAECSSGGHYGAKNGGLASNDTAAATIPAT